MSEEILEYVKMISDDRQRIMEELQGVHVEILKIVDRVFVDLLNIGIEEIIHSRYLGDDEEDG